MGGSGDYKLATLCRGYWRAKLRTTIHPFFEPGTQFLASSRFPGRCPFPTRSFLLDADNHLTTRILLPTNNHFASRTDKKHGEKYFRSSLVYLLSVKIII